MHISHTNHVTNSNRNREQKTKDKQNPSLMLPCVVDLIEATRDK